jgi:hypothetical protein
MPNGSSDLYISSSLLMLAQREREPQTQRRVAVVQQRNDAYDGPSVTVLTK